ncbi:hypothetical protein [Spirosoma endophyticum]|uniref:HPt domain-containing protein n=1 Tax=Spirosoma endophyticum TaxID=662367 RepID=A0A1I2HVN0_9BACT|nr:hypothetical protein [Spirosoma endophyticum]SFF33430.1 hypothetical protein SAMN05216167_14911 [Spirosoma endophyticum]
MKYLLDIYQDDEEGMKKILKGIYAQFEILPMQLTKYTDSIDYKSLINLCHVMSANAMMIGSYELKSKFLELEAGLIDHVFNPEEVSERVEEIQKLLPPAIESINIYLNYYD